MFDPNSPEALANDGLTQSLQDELKQLSKKYGIQHLLLLASSEQRAKDKDKDHPIQMRFCIAHGNVYALYGVASLYVKSFEAESIHNHVTMSIMRNAPPPPETEGFHD